MIRECRLDDIRKIYYIINEAAIAYEGIIPSNCYHQPYMPMHELRRERKRITFFGEELNSELIGIMGFQLIRDATLIRHAYVLSKWQRQGISSNILNYLKGMVTTPLLLVGTWAEAHWAIAFYKKHGFGLLSNKEEVLKTYWEISQNQIENSVVLGIDLKKGQT